MKVSAGFITSETISSPRRSTPLSRMEIDLDSIAHNLMLVRKHAGPKRKVIAALKADAYGHGAVAVARRLATEGVDLLAVGSVEEGLAVRASGVTTPILLLTVLIPEMAAEVVEAGLIPSIDQLEAARSLARLAKKGPIPIFIKVDCGFGRFGIAPETVVPFAREVLGNDGIQIEGVYTHVPFSDPPGLDWARQRIASFNGVVAALHADGIRPPITQAVASPGLFGGLEDPNNSVTIGHALYGLDPFIAGTVLSPPADLRPALTAVRSKLIHVGSSPPTEDTASYLRQRNHSRLGVIPVGIHHSYRPTPGDAFVLVDGCRASVLRPCLENSVIDLSDCPTAQIGAEVTIIGAESGLKIGLADLARWQNTSPLAILSAFGRALPRFYIGP